MLSDALVLKFIKSNLKIPYTYFELSDSELLDYIKEFVLKMEFSRYVPLERAAYVDVNDSSYIVQNMRSVYYIKEPEDAAILTVIELYLPNTDIVLGAPPIPIFSFGELDQNIMDMTKAYCAKPFSMFDYTWEFMHPNMIRVNPVPGSFTVKYEREHTDFATVPNQWRQEFLYLALGRIMVLIGNMRDKFKDIPTIYGPLNLNADTLLTRGDDMANKQIDKLQMLPMNTLIELI